ncbi:MAG: caspase family protein [Chlorogloeopsis fritschii C42_A2020_084]|uniref:caspase family protein n=1 Tax=Chlorogloeopsis fritschii TaxID=1124 RepID=UPI0019F51A88|nr:caspase family protein [Chlorogloeopsis fritschii]MBF2004701.1 caspase family protein [Chlorogloeopsis fritschii C42_A2020_084]
MKRRTFLQRFGSLLAVLGITEAEWFSLGNRYQQALAQPSSRKLALLIGINQYHQSQVLNGCLTDIELQQELLIHRFGFQPSDILVLTDEQANREFIESAFLEHLVKQAKLGDVVVFHFSGYGCRVRLGTLAEAVQNALITTDGADSKSQATKNANYLLEETLMLMLRSLPTERVTAVLDTSYYIPTTFLPTGLRIRSRQMAKEAIVATAELEWQKQLREKAATELSAIVLSATADPNQVAQEIQLSGFSAGLFTYALTQYLWETTPATTIPVLISRVGSMMQQFGSTQQPNLLMGKKNQQRVTLSEAFVPLSTQSAEGVVTAVEDEGKTVHLWLAGLPLQVLEYYGGNSRLTLVSQQGETAQLVLRSRNGLTAKAQLASGTESKITPQIGQLVQETVRVLPRNINLTVALDGGLERIERVDATSAFATIEHVTSVVAGEQPADYVFGELPDGRTKDLIASTALIVSPSRYGLFSLGSELIPSTIGEAGEAVKVAVQRLKPTLQTLLAAKLWRLTDNEGSSCLSIKATLEIMNSIAPRVVMQRETMRTLSAETASKKQLNQVNTEPGRIPIVPIGSKVQYRIQNMGTQPVYFMLLGLNSARNAIALYPWQKGDDTEDGTNNALLEDIVIAPGESLTLPQSTTGFEWVIQGPAFLSENQLIFSTAPFTQTRNALETTKHPRADRQRIQPLLNPLEVANALLQDLHNASSVKAEMNVATAEAYVLDVNNWASLGFIYEVI